MNRHGLSQQRYAEMMAIDALPQQQKDAYYQQRFGMNEAGLTQVLEIARSIESRHSITEKEANSLLPFFPGADKSHVAQLINHVNNSGMARHAFLEFVTSGGSMGIEGLNDAIRISDRWNKLSIENEVNEYLDKKHAHDPQTNEVKMGAKADSSAIGSDAHRQEIRSAIGNMMAYNQSRSPAKNSAELRARDARGSALEGTSVHRQIAEAFERRASPNYQAPEEGSIRDHLENAFDNTIADVAEAEVFGTVRGAPADEGAIND